MVVGEKLSTLGPESIADPRIGKYLQARWVQMHKGDSSVERKLAKRRFGKIVRLLFPDQRKHKDRRRIEAVNLVREVEEVRQSIGSIRRRRWRSPSALRVALREKHPQWPPEVVDALAGALWSRDRHAVRKALYSIVGTRFNLRPGTLPALVAESRKTIRREEKVRALQARITDGRDRYMAWCGQEGLSPLSFSP
jgi:hypothetical protein